METQIIVLAVVPIVVPAVLAMLSRSSRGVGQRGELGYSRALKGFSLVTAMLVPLGVLAILLAQGRPLRPDEYLPVVFLFLFFPALSLPLVLEFFRVRHDFDDAGLAFRSPWSRPRSLAWADVGVVKWRSSLKWLDLRTKDGVIVHVSPLLRGLGPFAEVALARIPAAVLTACPEGRDALQVMQAGRAGDLLMSPLPPAQLLTKVTMHRH